ncbi:MAG TPA: hypothetical protein ACFYD3_04675 [Candidatus Hypogeohydataceae bacterium YC41]
MKLFYKTSVVLALLFISCAQYQQVPDSFPQGYKGPAYMDVSYAGIILSSGRDFPVFVKVMDKDKNPLPSTMVTARLDGPNVAYFDRDQVATDKNGIAKFNIRGTGFLSWPVYATVTFTAGELSKSIEVYGPPR